MKIKPVRTYMHNGIKITVYDYVPPRKTQRTFPMIKGSVANLGAKAISLSTVGLLKRKHG